MFSNLGKYLSKNDLNNADEELLTDPLVLSYSASIIFTFAILSPCLSYFYLTFWVSNEDEINENNLPAIQNLKTMSLVEFISIYGYSYLIFIPGVIIASYPHLPFEFFSLFFSTAWSSLFIFLTLKNIANFAHLEVFLPELSDDLEFGYNLKEIEQEAELLDFESMDGDEDEKDDDVHFEVDVIEKREIKASFLLPFLVTHLLLGVTLKLKFFSNAR